MSEHKSPVQQALDLTLFGPLGAVMAIGKALPAWTEDTRQRVSEQVAVARVVGEFAARQGQQVAAHAVRQSTGTLVGLGIIPGPPPPPNGSRRVATPGPGRESESRARNGNGNGQGGGPGPAGSPDGGRRRDLPGRTGGASAELAIPGYDSLSASQVVQRLAGLAPPELEAVQAYESAGRGRRTILNKISQLQSGRS